MPWLLYICKFFSDFLCSDMSLLFVTVTLRGGGGGGGGGGGDLISIAYCLFFHCICKKQVFL